MEKTISMSVPETWVHGLEWDQTAVIQEIFRLGVQQYKIIRALEMIQADMGSLGFIAEKMGISKRELIREARSRGIEPTYDEQTLIEELGHGS
jgi:predicted HTH domain antitoxin